MPGISANSDGKYQKVGTKKPNAWGLYDMLGNVMEWTLDQYAALPLRARRRIRGSGPRKPYPIAVRGGSWMDPAGAIRLRRADCLGPELETAGPAVAEEHLV